MHTKPEFEQSETYGKTLFPRDFIYCIDEQPLGHFDNETLFCGGFGNAIWPIETPISDSFQEDLLLEEFLFLHVISRIIRYSLEDGIFHHTTMIHASRNVDDHMTVSDKMSDKIDALLGTEDSELEKSAFEVVEKYYPDLVTEFNENNVPLDEYSSCRIKDEIGLIKIIKLNSDDQQDIDALAYPSELIYPKMNLNHL